MARLDGEGEVAGGGDDGGGVGHEGAFELTGGGNRRVGHREALDGRGQNAEGAFRDLGGDFGGETARAGAFFDDEDTAGLAGRGDEGGGVKGRQGTHVDYFGLNLLLRQRGGGLQGQVGHVGPGDDGDVGAGARDPRGTGRDGLKRFGRLFEAERVEELVLEDEDGVRIGQRPQQKARAVGAVGAGDDLEARNPREEPFETLGMGGAVAAAGPHGGPQHEGAGLSVDVVELGGHVHELVDAERDEVHEHDFDDRPRAGDGGADGHAGEGGFGNRGVADALGTVFFDKAARDAEGAAVGGDVLAHEEDAGVVGQGAVQGALDELDGGKGAHA